MIRAFYFYEFLHKPGSDVGALSSVLCYFSCMCNQSNKDLVMAIKKVSPKAAF